LTALAWSKPESQRLSWCSPPHPPAAAPSAPVLRAISCLPLDVPDYSIATAQADRPSRLSRRCEKAPGAGDMPCPRLRVKEKGLFRSKVTRATRSPAWWKGPQRMRGLWEVGINYKWQ